MEMKDKLPAIILLLANPPVDFGFSDEQMEQIVRGECLRDHLVTIDKGLYLDNFLPWIQWCQSLGRVLVTIPDDDDDDCNESAESIEEERIAERLAGVMSLYARAWVAPTAVSELGSDPTGLEMIKRFWDLKQYVLTLVRRDFPKAGFEKAA